MANKNRNIFGFSGKKENVSARSRRAMAVAPMFFFPRDNSLISRGNSHVSRVRGLVVRCLLFNPEVSCSNPWVCANFFTSIPKQKVLTFFGTMRLFGFVRLFFGFVRLFFRNFLNVPKESSFQFFDILQENEC